MRGPRDGAAVDAERAAEHAVRLLQDPTVGFHGPNGAFRRLLPRDCCVLVRNRQQAAVIRQALQRRGLPSAYLSERDSVLASNEAWELLLLLKAMLKPQDLTTARRVWASHWMQRPLSQLAQERDDDRIWDQRLARLLTWSRAWHEQGVMAAVRLALQDEGAAARALDGSPGGERQVTNLLHLAEWLQQASAQYPTPADLVPMLESAIADPEQVLLTVEGARDATLLRLESDADLIQVVTIHKSKGLQYPVVILPFGAYPGPDIPPSRPGPTVQNGRWMLPAADDPSLAEQAARDELREDIRLLYVALTRAVHHVALGASPRLFRDRGRPAWLHTGLGRLVTGSRQGSAEVEATALVADLQRVTDHLRANDEGMLDAKAPNSDEPVSGVVDPVGTGHDAIEFTVLAPDQPVPCTVYHAPAAVQAAVTGGRRRGVATVAKAIHRGWRISSFSGLVREAIPTGASVVSSVTTSVATSIGTSFPGPGEGPSQRWDEPTPLRSDLASVQEAEANPAVSTAADAPAQAGAPGTPGAWHLLPSSAELGQHLHEWLELAAEHQFDWQESGPLLAELQSRLRCSGWSEHGETLQAWLKAVTGQALPEWGLALGQLQHCRAELEFWMPLGTLQTPALDSLLRQWVLPGRDRPALRAQRVQGLLMGFADLVIEHQGRYGVLDYKSNRLGPDTQAYEPAALEQAVLDHRYDLQAVIYVIALHRLLRSRLGPRYDPQQHLGPAQFFFIRGLDHAQGGVCTLSLPPPAIEAFDTLLNAP